MTEVEVDCALSQVSKACRAGGASNPAPPAGGGAIPRRVRAKESARASRRGEQGLVVHLVQGGTTTGLSRERGPSGPRPADVPDLLVARRCPRLAKVRNRRIGVFIGLALGLSAGAGHRLAPRSFLGHYRAVLRFLDASWLLGPQAVGQVLEHRGVLGGEVESGGAEVTQGVGGVDTAGQRRAIGRH